MLEAIDEGSLGPLGESVSDLWAHPGRTWAALSAACGHLGAPLARRVVSGRPWAPFFSIWAPFGLHFGSILAS